MGAAVIVKDLKKTFNLRHSHSLKETLVWLVKGRRGDLTRKFDALHDVSFEIQPGETVALLVSPPS